MFAFTKKRRRRRELAKFRDGLIARRHADDDILSEKQKTELSALIAEATEALKTPEATAGFIAVAPE